MDQLLASWPSSVDAQERTRRLIDLFLVSVLLDAGAGTQWSYKSKESGKIYKRSEGLAVASLEMFKAGYFSSHSSEPCQVDGVGLKRLSVQQLARGLQVTEQNPIMGLEGRAGLMSRLGDALRNTALFGGQGRPGHMLGIGFSRQHSNLVLIPSFRPSPLPPYYSGGLRTSNHRTNAMDRPHQGPCTCLALHTNSD